MARESPRGKPGRCGMSKRREPAELLRDESAVLFCSTGPTPSFSRSTGSAQTNVGDDANVLSEFECVSALFECDEGSTSSLGVEFVSGLAGAPVVASAADRVVSGFTGSFLVLSVGLAIEVGNCTGIGRGGCPRAMAFGGVELAALSRGKLYKLADATLGWLW